MTTGIVVTLLVYLFVHKAEAAALGVCRMFFGRDILFESYPIYMIDPILFAFPCSSLALVLGSYMTQEKEQQAVIPVVESVE